MRAREWGSRSRRSARVPAKEKKEKKTPRRGGAAPPRTLIPPPRLRGRPAQPPSGSWLGARRHPHEPRARPTRQDWGMHGNARATAAGRALSLSLCSPARPQHKPRTNSKPRVTTRKKEKTMARNRTGVSRMDWAPPWPPPILRGRLFFSPFFISISASQGRSHERPGTRAGGGGLWAGPPLAARRGLEARAGESKGRERKREARMKAGRGGEGRGEGSLSLWARGPGGGEGCQLPPLTLISDTHSAPSPPPVALLLVTPYYQP